MARKRSELGVSAAVGVPTRHASQRRARHTAPASEATPAAESRPAELGAVCEPSRAEIAQLAYSYWEARGYQGGSPEEDWLRAESDLRSRTAVGQA